MNTQSIIENLRALIDDAVEMMRKEVELAKTEVAEKLGQAKIGLALIFAGLLCVAVSAFLLAQALVAWLAIHVGPAAAAFIVGIVILIAGAAALAIGASHLRARNLKPVRTIRATTENATRLKETINDQVKRTY